MYMPFDAPALLDRDALSREDLNPSTLAGVAVSAGSVLMRDDKVVVFPPGQRGAVDLEFYLGLADAVHLAAWVPRDKDAARVAVDNARWVSLRDAISMLTLRGAHLDKEIATTAVALAAWHAGHQFCGVCGEQTVPRKAGWVRWCPRDEREIYPRTDPAVIVAITDPHDRIFMAHAAHWTIKRFSHVAGYVEPGESLEQAVHREVAEEVGMSLDAVSYVGSQPWPFPASIMVGFAARSADPLFTLDDEEITQAMWVSRDELPGLIASGDLVPAPHGSIARRMLEDWFGAPVPDPPVHGPIDV